MEKINLINKTRRIIQMKKVVVIGGGFAGSYIAHRLQNDYDVTLIDNKDYFEFTPGILRAIVEPGHLKKLQVPHKEYLKKARVLMADVTEISEKEVILKSAKIPFDYLFICSGCSYANPIREANVIISARGFHLAGFSEKLENSRKILIIGGGLVGIELAAEICTHSKDKKIKLIHLGQSLIERNSAKSQKYVEEFLIKHDVEVIFNEKITKEGKNIFSTDKGREIKPEMAFMCVGIIPNSDFMKKNFSKCLDERGAIKVNKFLQVVGHENIFAVGDINDLAVEKTAQNSLYQGIKAAKNLILLEKKKELVEYKGIQIPMVISLGKWNGIFEWKNFVVTGILPGLLKHLVEMKNMWLYRFWSWF